MIAYPKHQYIRSPALMKAYREIPCQSCGADDGTVCGAHSNWSVHHKGGRIKADDNRCASMCMRCHASIDQGSRLSREERVTLWTEAHRKTVRELLRRGLWPTDIPVPDIRSFH